MGSISPEMRRLPGLIKDFNHDGLLGELLRDIARGNQRRNFIEDMSVLAERVNSQVEGLENLPPSGGLVAFNHPEVHIIAPALFSLAIKMAERFGDDRFTVVMGSEMPLTPQIYFPFSPLLIQRFADLYPETFLLVPTYKSRSDYRYLRNRVSSQVVEKIRSNRFVFIAPEGRVGEDGSIQDVSVYRKGYGDLARYITSISKPIIPLGVWLDQDQIKLKIGQPFAVHMPGRYAAIKTMKAVSEQLPNSLRGPFISPS